MTKIKTCPWCGIKPRYDKDVKSWHCNTDGCVINGICLSGREWNNRKEKAKDEKKA